MYLNMSVCVFSANNTFIMRKKMLDKNIIAKKTQQAQLKVV